jgi:hypothetical protein
MAAPGRPAGGGVVVEADAEHEAAQTSSGDHDVPTVEPVDAGGRRGGPGRAAVQGVAVEVDGDEVTLHEDGDPTGVVVTERPFQAVAALCGDGHRHRQDGVAEHAFRRQRRRHEKEEREGHQRPSSAVGPDVVFRLVERCQMSMGVYGIGTSPSCAPARTRPFQRSLEWR